MFLLFFGLRFHIMGQKRVKIQIPPPYRKCKNRLNFQLPLPRWVACPWVAFVRWGLLLCMRVPSVGLLAFLGMASVTGPFTGPPPCPKHWSSKFPPSFQLLSTGGKHMDEYAFPFFVSPLSVCNVVW